MDWAWNLPSVQPSVQHQEVQAAGTTNEPGGPQPTTRTLSFADVVLDSPVSASTLSVRAVPPAGEFVLYGGAAVGSDGTLSQLFGKTDTKYRQVYADADIRVLQNTAALPRAFLVPSARVAPNLGSALSQMIHQPFQPDQEVILADDTTTLATDSADERGGHGTAQIVSYAPDEVRLHTSADGDAWLVLSDTYYPGWTASVDGQPTPVLRGDVLFRVVPVPAAIMTSSSASSRRASRSAWPSAWPVWRASCWRSVRLAHWPGEDVQRQGRPCSRVRCCTWRTGGRCTAW